jgi:YhcH/YjgK/YiaL family protein
VILASLEQEEQYRHAYQGFAQAFDFLKQSSLAELAPGKYEIDGDRIFAMIQHYESKPEQNCGWESHRKYIDIQYLIAGNEKINVAPSDQLLMKGEYIAEKDKISYEIPSIKSSSLQLHAGEFAVFFPQDAHQASISSSEAPVSVKKVVLKIQV